MTTNDLANPVVCAWKLHGSVEISSAVIKFLTSTKLLQSLKNSADLFSWRCSLVNVFANSATHFDVTKLKPRHQEIFFASEMVVETRLGDTRLLKDLVDPSRAIALSIEQVVRTF